MINLQEKIKWLKKYINTLTPTEKKNIKNIIRDIESDSPNLETSERYLSKIYDKYKN